MIEVISFDKMYKDVFMQKKIIARRTEERFGIETEYKVLI